LPNISATLVQDRFPRAERRLEPVDADGESRGNDEKAQDAAHSVQSIPARALGQLTRMGHSSTGLVNPARNSLALARPVECRS
jgi:hypothetical protein